MRQISIIVAILLLGGAIVASRFIGRKPEEKAPEAPQKPIRQIRTLEVKNQTLAAPIRISGKLVAPDKVELFAEVSGLLLPSNPAFKEGNVFPAGAALLRIDSEELRLNLQAQKSSLLNAITRLLPDMKLDYPQDFEHWEKYVLGFDIRQALSPLPTPSHDKLRYFIISNNLYNQYYTIKSQENRLQKYTIAAPFSGVVTEANINPGSLVRIGQKLGEIINNYGFELEAAISLKDVDFVREGDVVLLHSEDIQGEWKGTIRRISRRIDPQNQSVTLYIQVGGERLREGMFLQGDLKANEVRDVFAIPRDLLLDESRVFVVENNRLQKKEVQVVRFTNNQVLVKGLANGTQLAAQSSQEFYNGLEVKVIR
ncbi:MAG: HlyD family efflux transporter periplasmic adaptor subunit [Microscillaceae bacterium]|nr:HlyD family efflux transporter periplasmic adaptor subunit [Microscillaceae bacterium]